MTKEGDAKIVYFNTIGAGGGGLMLGRDYMSYYSEYLLSSTQSICIILIAIVLREYNAAFLYHCWFSFILWWCSKYTNMSPSDKKSV